MLIRKVLKSLAGIAPEKVKGLPGLVINLDPLAGHSGGSLFWPMLRRPGGHQPLPRLNFCGIMVPLPNRVAMKAREEYDRLRHRRAVRLPRAANDRFTGWPVDGR